MNGSEILLNILKKHKVRYIFGYQSTTVEPFIDTINNFPEIQFIQIDNQQSAGFVAETYARASGNLGVVAIASGLEAMELASPMYNALRNSTPLVAFIGQSESTLITSKGYQQADSIGVFLPITKHTVHISNIEQFQSDVEELITVSLSSKQGPVLLEVPKDIQLQKGNYIDNFQVNPTNLKRQIVLDQKVIEEAAGMITQAKKPLIFCGHGVIIAKAEHEFKELIEKTGSPVACTLHGISGFPSGHPLNFGLMGIDGHLEIDDAMKDADLIVSLGMRVDESERQKLKDIGSKARIIHVEIDPALIVNSAKEDLIILGDIKEVLVALNKVIQKGDYSDWISSLEKKRDEKDKRERNSVKIGFGPEGKLLTKTVLTFLSNLTLGNDNIVADSGEHQKMIAKHYDFKRFNTWFTNAGKNSPGFGLPAAIGVKFARPNEEVWCITDSLGFQTTVQHLKKLTDFNLNINIIVINQTSLDMKASPKSEEEQEFPDLIRIAGSYGVPGLRITKLEEIENAINWSKTEKTPTLLEFICDPKDYTYPMVSDDSEVKTTMIDEDDLSNIPVSKIRPL